jgi:hypothetical protein
VKLVVRGADRDLLVGADFRVGPSTVSSDEVAPIRERVRRSELRKHGKTRFGSTATLLDGRVTTLGDKRVRRCR